MSSSEYDSEEDLPIAALGKRYQANDAESEEAEFDDGDDFEEQSDDNGNGVVLDDNDFIDDDESEDGDESYEDDIPLKDLKTKKKKTKKESSKKSPATKKKTPAKKKKPTSSPKKKPAPKKKKKKTIETSTSSLVTASSELYSKSQKGRLIQALLCRWWYAYTWPDPSSLPEDTPKNYDALDGFPGVYVCTSGDDVGKIKDYRDKSNCPNFNNFAKKSSEELQQLLVKAIKNQREALIQAEGTGTATERELKDLEKWANKLNVNKAEKDAAKVLKVAKLTIP